ncbi:Slp family lipoprotein [Geothermobacter hydrogeniphilus]|nr:Slp family lipoprotein [Geothermobacter hydrogeniphilus]
MRRFILLLILVGLTGCGHVLSEQARSRVDSDVNLAEVRADPEAYRGKTLLLGGVIMGLDNEQEGSVLEITPWRLDRWGEPIDLDDGSERILVESDRPLDPARFLTGRMITFTADVRGQQIRSDNYSDRRYPVFHLQREYLWDTPFRTMIHPGPNRYAPTYVGPDAKPRSNPYDPGYYDAYPYTPYDFRPGQFY